MNKIAVLSLFLLLSNLLSAQSAREINKQLKTEFIHCLEKQDSITELFKAKEYPLAMIKGETMHKLYILGLEKDSTRELIEVTAQLVEKLKMLGVDLKSLISIDKKPVLPDYKVLTDPMQKVIKTHLDIGLPPNRAYYNGLSLEEQNKMLREEVNENEYYLNYISSEYNQMGPQLKQLTALAPKLDSMQLVYQLLRKELSVTKMKLTRKLQELKANYVSKGPDGFSPVYKQVFPEVGSTVKIEKRVFERLELEPEPDMGPGKRSEPIIYEIPDEPALFPDGNSALLKYLAGTIRYPKIAIELGIPSSKQFVQFVVSERGTISNVQVKPGMRECPECDAEIIRVVKLMPKWIPAKINGKSVNSWFILPVTICLM